MSDQDPIPNQNPPQDTPISAADDNSKAIHTALTGIAGMLLGGVLLGKRGGLLAGLVGIGAKVWLEKSTQTSAPMAPPNSAEPAPAETISDGNDASPIPPVRISSLEETPPLREETAQLNAPTPETIQAPEISPQAFSVRDTPPIELIEPGVPAFVPITSAPVEWLSTAAAVPESTELPAADRISEMPTLPEETVLLDPLTETLPPVKMVAQIVPSVQPTEPVVEDALTPPAIKPIPLAEIPNEPQPVPSPTAVEMDGAPVDIELDAVIKQVEAFRNYGRSEATVEAVPAVLNDLRDPLLDESAWTPPPSMAAEQENSALVATPNQDPLTEISDDPAFVNWPEVPVSDPHKSSAFQSFVATMFSELAESPSAQERPTEPLPASADSSFIPPMAAAIASESAMEPLVVSESAAPFVEADPPVSELSPAEAALSPEDIWRLAAEETPTEKPEPVSLIPEFPAVDPILTKSPTALVVPIPPTVEEADSLPTFHSFAAFAAEANNGHVPSPAEPALPSGMDKFVELFGTSAEQTAEDFFKTAAPFQNSAFPTPETFAASENPVNAGSPQSFDLPSKRSAFLTPEEESELSKFQRPTPAPSKPQSIFPIVQESVEPDVAPVIVPLSFPVAGNRVERHKTTQTNKGGGWKLLLTLLFLGMICGGYIYREQVIKQWSLWFPPQNIPAPAAPASLPSTAPLPRPGPTPVPTPIPPPTPTPEPTPAATSPSPPTTELPPVVPPQPVPSIPPPMPAGEPTPEPIPTPQAPPAKIEVRPAATLPELPTTPEPIVSPANEPLKPEDAAQQAAMTSVKSFLSASNTDQLLEHVLNADNLKNRVQSYYPESKVTPTQFDNIVLDSGGRVPETNSRAFLFRVRSPERPQGFPVCTEETPKGYKIEWEAFIQCRDRAVEQFWKTPGAEPANLFVVLKRSHYFEDDMPDIDSYECFRVNSPNPDEEAVYAFARKDSAMVKKNRALLIWDANYFAVAKFAHVKNSAGKTHVEIVDIDRFNWRSQGR